MAGGPKGITWFERGTSLFLAFAATFTCVFGLIAAAVTIRADVDDLKKYKVESKVDMEAVKSVASKQGEALQRVDERTLWMQKWMERRDR